MRMPTSPLGRRLILAAVAVLVLAGGVLLPFAWSASHPLRPGLKGCGSIRNADPRIDCTRDHVLEAVKKDGLKSALVELDALPRSPQRLSECHSSMHVVGRTIAKTTKLTGDSLVSGSSTQACSSGVAHGALEQVVASDPDSLQETAAAICLHTKTRRESEACFHGSGHGLVRAHRKETNSACSSLRADGGASPCLAGASMERNMRAKTSKDLSANARRARKNCSGSPAVIVSCYVYFSYAVLPPGADWTLKRYIDVCNKYAAPGPESWGCSHRASNTVKSRSEIDGCTRLRSEIAVQVCAASIAAESDASQLSTTKLARYCASHVAVAFGCGAGMGRMLFWKGKPNATLDQMAAPCDDVSPRAVSEGCRAGARGCWFPERVDRTDAECLAASLPRPISQELSRYGGTNASLWSPQAISKTKVSKKS